MVLSSLQDCSHLDKPLTFYFFSLVSINGVCEPPVFVFHFFFFRPDLKVILMSATLNSEMFSAYFGMINKP